MINFPLSRLIARGRTLRTHEQINSRLGLSKVSRNNLSLIAPKHSPRGFHKPSACPSRSGRDATSQDGMRHAPLDSLGGVLRFATCDPLAGAAPLPLTVRRQGFSSYKPTSHSRASRLLHRSSRGSDVGSLQKGSFLKHSPPVTGQTTSSERCLEVSVNRVASFQLESPADTEPQLLVEPETLEHAGRPEEHGTFRHCDDRHLLKPSGTVTERCRCCCHAEIHQRRRQGNMKDGRPSAADLPTRLSASGSVVSLPYSWEGVRMPLDSTMHIYRKTGRGASSSACSSVMAEARDQASPEELRKWAIFTRALVTMIVFGIVDNGFMLFFGEMIDNSVGVRLGLSTLTAAAFGQVISDSVSTVLGFSVGAAFEGKKWTEPSPLLRVAGATLGVLLGCCIGMGLFLLTRDLNGAERRKRLKELEPILTTIAQEAQRVIGVESCRIVLKSVDGEEFLLLEVRKNALEGGGGGEEACSLQHYRSYEDLRRETLQKRKKKNLLLPIPSDSTMDQKQPKTGREDDFESKEGRTGDGQASQQKLSDSVSGTSWWPGHFQSRRDSPRLLSGKRNSEGEDVLKARAGRAAKVPCVGPASQQNNSNSNNNNNSNDNWSPNQSGQRPTYLSGTAADSPVVFRCCSKDAKSSEEVPAAVFALINQEGSSERPSVAFKANEPAKEMIEDSRTRAVNNAAQENSLMDVVEYVLKVGRAVLCERVDLSRHSLESSSVNKLRDCVTYSKDNEAPVGVENESKGLKEKEKEKKEKEEDCLLLCGVDPEVSSVLCYPIFADHEKAIIGAIELADKYEAPLLGDSSEKSGVACNAEGVEKVKRKKFTRNDERLVRMLSEHLSLYVAFGNRQWHEDTGEIEEVEKLKWVLPSEDE